MALYVPRGVVGAPIEVRQRDRHRAQLVEVVAPERFEQFAELVGYRGRVIVVVDLGDLADISMTGQYVMPSPYGRQRPRTTSAVSPSSTVSVSTKRLLPTPADPSSAPHTDGGSR